MNFDENDGLEADVEYERGLFELQNINNDTEKINEIQKREEASQECYL